MVQSKQKYLITGELTDQQKILHEIGLIITTNQVSGKHGKKDETISEIKFACNSPVPDGGPYILQYVFRGQHENQVHVKQGILIKS